MIKFRVYRACDNIIYQHCSVFNNNVFAFTESKHVIKPLTSFTLAKDDKVMLGYESSLINQTLFEGDIVQWHNREFQVIQTNGKLQLQADDLIIDLPENDKLDIVGNIFHCKIL